jgi:hypothetical protein
MPILNLREMGSVGVVSDIAPWDLPPNALSDGMNFRLQAGKIQSAGGIDPVSPDSTDRLGHIAQSTDAAGNSSWVVCGQSSISLLRANGFDYLAGEDVSNSDATKWSTCQIGSVMFLNHPDLYPMYWVDEQGDGTPSQIKPLPWHINGDGTVETWEDKGYRCRILRAHKNFLFALATYEGDEEYPDRVFWSHPAEPNGIPFSWRPTIEQPDSIAGAVSLGRGGAIVGGESLRDSFVIYSEKALSVMDYTGDSLGWRRRAVSETAGLVSKEAIQEVKGMHIFFSGDDVLSYDGNQMSSLMHNRLRSRLGAKVNWQAASTSWAAHYQTFNEVWFAVPEDGAQSPTTAYCFNYRDNTWSIRDLEKSISHGSFGSTPSTVTRPWEGYLTKWSDERGTWGQGGERPFEKALYGLSDGTVFDLDPGVSTLGGGTTQYKDATWDTADLRPEVTSVLDWDASFNSWSESNQTWDYVYIDQLPGAGGDYIWAGAVGKWDDRADSWEQIYIDQLPEGDGENIWAGATGIWEDRTDSWNESTASGTWDSYYDVTWDSINPIFGYKRSDTFLLRTDIPIGGHEGNTTITRVYPYIDGSSDVEIRFGSQQNAGGEIRWAGGFRKFTPGKDRKIDVRTTGELHAYEIRSSGTDFFDLTGMDIEFSMAGSR